jgi:hypothetical protein
VVEERSLEREVAIEEKFEVSEDGRRVREIWGEEWKKFVRENRENELRVGISGVVVMGFLCAWGKWIKWSQSECSQAAVSCSEPFD